MKWMHLLEFIMGLDIKYYLVLKKMMLFPIELRYFTSRKSGITYVFSRNYERIKIDSSNSLPLEKMLIFHNVIILIKLVFNKEKNHYHYNIFLERVFIWIIKLSYVTIKLTFLKELMLNRNWKTQTFRMHFLRKEFQECILCGSDFQNVFFEGAILKMHFLREQFWERIFWTTTITHCLFTKFTID